MKKIGLFLDTLPLTGGVFQYNLSMLHAVASLPGEGYEVVVAYTSPQWQEYLDECRLPSIFVNYHFPARLLSIWLNIFRFPVSLWQRLSPLMFRYARLLTREKCDLWIFPSQDAVSYQLTVPALVTILDLAHRYARRFPESASRFEYLIREQTYKNICHWAKGVLVDSQAGRRQVAESYSIPLDCIHTLSYVAPHYMHASETPAGFASRYRLPAKYIFYPAQFWEHKNHKNLLKAVASLKNDLPALKLVLAGSKKNAYDGVASMVHDLHLSEDVLFLGYVPNEDMPELYRRARALVMPTYFGPTNIPPLEASIVGCPVAVSHVSSMPEQLGDSALVFDPDSVNEIADCIRRLWTDDILCTSLAETGKQQMARWGEREFNARLAEIIAKVVGEQPELTR
jgi:glycosyltransferase involved in cell wall biosynthesis